MAVVTERLPRTVARERQAVVLRCLGAVMAITGMALALFFGVGPVRITVQAQVPVEQVSGDQGTGLTATGQTHAVRDFLSLAFAAVGIDDWERYVHIDPRFLRPTEGEQLVGDTTKAREVLGWAPTVSFEELVTMMVEADLAAERKAL